MAETPAWLQSQLGLTAFAYLAQFLMMGIATPNTSGNFFQVIARFITFNSIPELGWFSFVVFLIVAVPWIILIGSEVLDLFKSVTGSVIALAIIGFVGFTFVVGFT